MKHQVDVLLAVYMGECFLPQQLDSLLEQTFPDWHILARDDGSSDATLQILGSFAQANPGQLRIIEDTEKGLGARGNFSRLLGYSTAPYVMFCDQDDVWLPNKIEITLAKMKALEAKYGADTPLLVYTDLKVVDSNLGVISPSFWKYQNLDPSANGLNRLLVQIVATGCTVMINAHLRRLANPIPVEAVMHDWWLALVAVCFGKLDYVSEPTILYRQHGQNDTGARRFNLEYVLGKARDVERIRKVNRASQRQARAFLERFEQQLAPRQRQLVATYAGLSQYNFWLRRYYVLRNGYFKTGLARNLGLLLWV